MTFTDYVRRGATSHGRGATPDALNRLEDAIGGRIPRDYSVFLLELGWAELDWGELLGIGDDVPPSADLHATMVFERRSDTGRTMPRGFMPVMTDGAGGYYVVRTGDESSAVFHVAHDDSEDPAEVAKDLTDWLEDFVRPGAGDAPDQDAQLEARMDDVPTAEVRLDARFPRSYTSLLLPVGGSEFGAVRILGLGPTCMDATDLVAQNLRLRGAGLPADFLAVAVDSAGAYAVSLRQDDLPIYYWDRETGSVDLVDRDVARWIDDLRYGAELEA